MEMEAKIKAALKNEEGRSYLDFPILGICRINRDNFEKLYSKDPQYKRRFFSVSTLLYPTPSEKNEFKSSYLYKLITLPLTNCDMNILRNE